MSRSISYMTEINVSFISTISIAPPEPIKPAGPHAFDPLLHVDHEPTDRDDQVDDEQLRQDETQDDAAQHDKRRHAGRAVDRLVQLVERELRGQLPAVADAVPRVGEQLPFARLRRFPVAQNLLAFIRQQADRGVFPELRLAENIRDRVGPNDDRERTERIQLLVPDRPAKPERVERCIAVAVSFRAEPNGPALHLGHARPIIGVVRAEAVDRVGAVRILGVRRRQLDGADIGVLVRAEPEHVETLVDRVLDLKALVHRSGLHRKARQQLVVRHDLLAQLFVAAQPVVDLLRHEREQVGRILGGPRLGRSRIAVGQNIDARQGGQQDQGHIDERQLERQANAAPSRRAQLEDVHGDSPVRSR
ncbi:hypothetical protein [Cohnella rhizosphaerae]|uniref:Uncharacterized protein n=1 Tax=Cohnella rhizosphaerae TaxID=1457232 RepID=A0A9X4QVL8_9BACL|nr:hypothetical protein [Cohnella rhizosphaerae]MDG0811617.1 hypothetical protein [Cohnella rhizosphaerae]